MSKEALKIRAEELLNYLEDVVKLGYKQVNRLEEHGNFLLYANRLPQVDEILVSEKLSNMEDTFLTIKRPDIASIPAIPDLLKDWIEVSSEPEIEPKVTEVRTFEIDDENYLTGYDAESECPCLNETLVNDRIPEGMQCSLLEKRVVEERFNDLPARVSAYDQYKEEWTKWSAIAKTQIKCKNLFDNLFKVGRTLQYEEDMELVLGYGIVSWNVNDHTLNYPIVSRKMVIEHNAKQNVITVTAPDDVFWKLELELLINLEIGDLKKIRNAFENIVFLEDGENPFLEILQETSGLAPDGKVVEMSPSIDFKPTTSLKVFDGWVLFLRQRSHNELLWDIRTFKQKVLENYENLPSSIEKILSDPSTEQVQYNHQFPTEWDAILNPEILFPKLANEEQIQIVEAINYSDGVVVQGPPGTGKSHTIANLICHFMAHGKKVLVTSQKDQALKVLHNMLPELLQPLCMPVLQNDAGKKQKLEKAVDYISKIVNDTQDKGLKDEVRNLTELFSRKKREIEELATQLRVLAHAELPIIVGDSNHEMEPAVAAKKVEEESKQYSWFIDIPTYQQVPTVIEDRDVVKLIFEYPLSEEEFTEIKELYQKIHTYLSELVNFMIPDITKIISPDEFKQMAHDLDNVDKLEKKADEFYAGLILRDCTGLDEFLTTLENVVNIYNSIHDSWALEFMQQDQQTLEQLEKVITSFEAKFTEIESLHSALNVMAKVEWDENFTLEEYKEIVEQTSERVTSGKKPLGFFEGIIGKKKTAVEGLRIYGRKPQGREEWQEIVKQISEKVAIKEFGIYWDGFRNSFSANQIPELAVKANFHEVKDLFNTLKNAYDYTYRLRPLILQKLSEFLIGGAQQLGNIEDNLENIYQSLLLKKQEAEFAHAKATYEQVRGYLQLLQEQNPHPLVNEFCTCLTNDWSEISNYSAHWEATYENLKELTEYVVLYERFKVLLTPLGNHAPNWASMWQNPTLTEEDIHFADWKEAWQHAILKAYLKEIANREEKITVVDQELVRCQKEIATVKENLILVRTKLRLKENITEKDMISLKKWQYAITRLGRGTGKHAGKWRKEVQEHMQAARNAVPVWIMPMYHVSQTLAREFGYFDVVIVDEASQCDIRSLVALFRAKKVIVVGDHHQISPSAVGIKEDQLNAFRREHLKTFPHAEMMDLKTSLYDLARVIFSSRSNIMLREHFRCLPEIIDFSNHLCYNDKIIPLRSVPDSQKLKPVLQSIFVPNGCRENKVNSVEAEAICRKVKEMVEDSRYADKTIGIISLTGAEQAKYIINLLDQYVSPRQQEEHRINVGDAYTFQGDERDIIILSMVVSRDDNFRSLVTDGERQRFNVAASRARDQLILFHSVTLGEDLKRQDDLRYQLLNYIQNGQFEEKIINYKKKFESPFEEDVYNWLTARGYRVIPQVEVGSYRIDLMVEGENDRLAVECDGDRWHGPDRWWEDRMRQRQLERVGLKFWRISGSSFYHNRDQAMQSILPRLKELGIEPVNEMN